MDCKTFRKTLPQWLAGKIDGRTRVAFHSHANACDHCRRTRDVRTFLREVVLEANRDERPAPVVIDLLERAKARDRG